MNDEERDQLGQIVRKAMQRVGVSSRSAWEDIGDERREVHRNAADELFPLFNLWLQRMVGEWGNRTFPQSTPDTILAHLRDEIDELIEARETGEDVAVEAADCFLLLLHFAYRNGFGLVDNALRKHKINVDRTWVTQMNERGYFVHIEQELA